MPDYHLYDTWVEEQLAAGGKRKDYSYYLDYSIGFLTRGCFRKCTFCVNQNYDRVYVHSPLPEFLDTSRKKICLLDDNFFDCLAWKKILQKLKATSQPFRFMQGMDERLLNEEKCKELFSSKYDGDYIFAFDEVNEAEIIEQKILLAKKYTKVVLKFYCFTGFDRNDKWNEDFWIQDIFDLLSRIEILMRHKCMPYVMRFNRYEESPYRGVYIPIARWCNQPSLYKKKSLREFAELNGKSSACYRYLSDFEKKFPKAAYFYDLKYERSNEDGV